jgi:hypothetical protein
MDGWKQVHGCHLATFVANIIRHGHRGFGHVNEYQVICVKLPSKEYHPSFFPQASCSPLKVNLVIAIPGEAYLKEEIRRVSGCSRSISEAKIGFILVHRVT